MTKNEFLSALERQLASLPESDRKRSILYFDEIIADRMEEGLSEEEVIAEMVLLCGDGSHKHDDICDMMTQAGEIAFGKKGMF